MENNNQNIQNNLVKINLLFLCLLLFGLQGCGQTKKPHKAPVVRLNGAPVNRAHVNRSHAKVSANKPLPLKPKVEVKSQAKSQVKIQNKSQINSQSKSQVSQNKLHAHPSLAENRTNKTSKNSQSPKPLHPPTTAIKNNIRWNWPVRGQVLRPFQDGGKAKGIDISGKHGHLVKAAANGTVVYSGNALKGYGNLIIIKHEEDFLSAYAHNQELMVKEGERVILGQSIAKMGQTDADRVKLHFEIRYKGKPVDPIRILPKS